MILNAISPKVNTKMVLGPKCYGKRQAPLPGPRPLRPGSGAAGPGGYVAICVASRSPAEFTVSRNHYFHAAGMPSGLERWHGGDDLHFISFS